ncbi:MAG TPA: YfiR family protein [Casimicrobiaceae bacterium]
MDILRSRLGRTAAAVAFGAWAAMAGAPGADADTAIDREHQIKVAFVYNFVRFVDWPTDVLPDSRNTITVCVLSDDPIYVTLESIDGKIVKGRRLTVQRVDAVKELASCHVAFFGVSEEKRLPQVMPSLENASVLTVGEIDRFAQSGGIINLVVVNNKVRFEINVDQAERAKLKLGSQLLSVATIVKG